MGLSAFVSAISFLSLLGAGFGLPGVGTPAFHSQKALDSPLPIEPVVTTTWGAECVSRVISITLEQTSDKSYTSEGLDYDISLYHALGTKKILTTGTYNVSTRLCTPSLRHRISGRRADTIQFLIHGATYNSMMWDWPLDGETYSWTKKMNEAGWATFAWDLIGAGNSTRPDGLVEAHVQTHVVTTHKLIGLLKSGSIGDRSWKHIVAAGFSIGGATLNSLADQYPEDTEAVILFGFSHNSLWLYPGFLAGLQAPAYQIDPVRWRDIPWTYQSTSTLQSRAVACYYGDYDHKQLVFDFENRDFDSLGAAITLVLHMLKAPDYKGHVFVGNGDQDATFCGLHCGNSLELAYKYIPRAASYDLKIYPRAGHQLLFHHSGPQFMEDVVEFLTGRGY